MKKILLFAALVFAGTANAQTEQNTENNPVAKGKWVISGSTSLDFNSSKPVTKQNGLSQDGEKTNTFTIRPSVGYFVIDNLAVGIGLELSTQKTKEYFGMDEYKDVKSTLFAAIPSATYYFSTDSKFFPYLGAGAGYASVKSKVGNTETQNDNFFVWDVKGGVMYMLTKNISADFGLNYNQMSTKYNEGSMMSDSKLIFKSFGATIGFNIFF